MPAEGDLGGASAALLLGEPMYRARMGAPRASAPNRRAVVLVLGLALAARLAAVYLAADGPVCCDAEDYLRLGESIADGEGFPESMLVADGGASVFRPPAYPVLLGAVLALPGAELRAVELVQIALGVAAVGLLTLLAHQLFRRAAVTIAAGAIAAVYPMFVFQAPAFLSEALFLPLEIAVLCAAWQARDSVTRPWRWTILAGALLGLAALTRQTGMLLGVPVAYVLLTAPGRAWGPRVRSLALAALMALAVIAPWTIRNATVVGEPVLVGRQTGMQLAGIYNPQSAEAEHPALWAPFNVIERDAELATRRGLSEIELDDELTERAIEYARDHPTYVAEAVIRNGIRMLDLEPALNDHFARTSNVTSGQAHLIRWTWFIVAILAAVGASTQLGRRAPCGLWLTALPFFAAGAVTSGFVRYRAPVDPFAVLLAATAVVALVERFRTPATSEG